MFKNKSILVFSIEFPPAPGGAGEYLFNLFQPLIKSGNANVLCASINGNGKRKEKIGKGFIYRYNVKRNKVLILLKGIFSLLNYIINKKPGIIIAGDTSSQRIVYFLSWFVVIKYITISHGSDVLWNLNNSKLRRIFLLTMYKRAIKNIAVSLYTSNILKQYGLKRRSLILYPGVNEELVNSQKTIFKTDNIYNLSKSNVLILSISRLDPRKGHSSILKAMSQLDINKEWKYIVAGSGRELERLKNQCKELKLTNKVIFTGFISKEEKIKLLDRANIFILASKEDNNAVEGFGISYIEASVRGTCVLGGNHGGVPEAVLNNHTGLLFNSNDITDIREKLEMLLTNDNLRISMAKKGVDFVKKERIWKNSQVKLNKLIKELK